MKGRVETIVVELPLGLPSASRTACAQLGLMRTPFGDGPSLSPTAPAILR